MKLSQEVSHYRPADRFDQTCHNCLYRQGSECSKVTVTPSPVMVCDTWILKV